MYILGLTTMTESAAVLLRDGRVVAAAEEERFSRVKHAGGFPHRSVRFVLESQGLTPGDIDHVAVYWDPYQLATRVRYMIATALRDPRLFLEKVRRLGDIWSGNVGEDSGWGSLFLTGQKFAKHFGQRPRQIHFLDHHTCHVASAVFGSGWEECAVLVMDGSGEAACTTTASAQGIALKILDQHLVPHSLGHFYSAVTGFLGFKMLDGEYKMMGLSPYGDPAGARWIRSQFLRTPAPGRYRLEPGVLDYHRALKGNYDGAFQRYFGPPRERSETAEFTERHSDIAASAQRAFEEVVLDLARELRRTTGMARLAIAGGCGLNCTANGKILAEGIFEEIYIPPVPHDPGGALGAAMLLYLRLTGRRPEPVAHAQFGPAFEGAALDAALARRTDLRAVKLDSGEAIRRAAHALAQGQVISWMQGPMEYGPRALGNRSFLASPLDDGIRDVINQKIKKRELFRPFAPSVKAERAAEYFELEQSAPFMTIVVPVRQEKRAVIPAITHVDGTARPQTVERSLNPRYWQLLDEFEQLTGVPVLLNTSFNIQEPIVCTPDDALATFARSGVDALVLGEYWVTHAVRPSSFSGEHATPHGASAG